MIHNNINRTEACTYKGYKKIMKNKITNKRKND